MRMTEGRDVDETILDLANSLVRKTNNILNISGRQSIFNLDEIPTLLVALFELITSEVVQDDVHDISNPEDVARTLQMIIDTLEEIMNVQMNHITGLGLVTLNRRQLYDALQIFHNLVSCMKEDAVIEGEKILQDGDDKRDSDNTTVNQIASARMENVYKGPRRKERASNRRPVQNLRQETANNKTQAQGKLGTSLTKQPPIRKVNCANSQSQEVSARRKPLTNIGNALREHEMGKGNGARRGNCGRKMSVEDDVFTSSTRCGRPLSNFRTSVRGNVASKGTKKGTDIKKIHVNDDVLTSSVRRRKHSIVSTKVKRHRSNSHGSVFKRSTRVKRGDLSPQTVSLCSSLKLLEEFDYLKRRYKEIQAEIQEHMAKVRELQNEELRIEHVLSHVQQLANSAKTRKKSRVQRSVIEVR